MPYVFLLLACVGAELVGPQQVETYRLAEVRLRDAGESSQAIWDIRPAGCDYHQHGHTLVLTGQPGEYEVEAIVVDFDARKLDRLRHRIVIGKPGPGPVPPEPDPDPDPPKPDPLTGLAKTVYELALAANDKATAAKIADNYQGVSAAINAGAYSGDLFAAKTKIVGDLFKLNNPLASGKPAWTTMFDRLNEIFGAADQAGELSSVAEIAKRFSEIERGLRRAAQ